MQVLQAGNQQLIALELDAELVSKIAQQSGFTCKVTEGVRGLTAELTAEAREAPLLLFDAADPANLGWFSRCQFYIDGRTGNVLQTPISVANKRDRSGVVAPNCVKVNIARELPVSFRLPGKQPLTEQVFYALLFNFLSALLKTGVAVCGGAVIQPLAGRTENIGPRN